MQKSMSRAIILRRMLFSIVIGLLLGLAISEITFSFLRETARPPKNIELIIPAGTAAQVARGEQPPSIPDALTLVAGDTLIVRNEDVTDHQLGPLWIPAGASASLRLTEADSYDYSCSFQPSRSIGLDVHESLTWSTRLEGIFFTGIPLAVLLALYSLIFTPKRMTTN
jgi:hypothetical protein